ncbi:MAG: acyl-ACP--UDP-N-acetylglucosamine O-acyltransferase [Porticoccaceae bacterium]|nr:acyl-ACP--UDP-N-acetylglucosamine O-acyltransferase [Pseudomonadales bacterium]MCP5171904.1 acyl-ACP--UDP-N-acetylglucosamine O-acyltransferase [Pseudomonadales bacterium]
MIDPRAVIDPSAKIASGVEIGPWTIIGPDVEIAEGTVISSHVVIKGPTVIGRNNRIFQFSTIGDDTPDLKYQGEATRLEMGDNNVIREGVTIHRGTIQDSALTKIGNHNLFMAYAHVGHDCVIGHHCILVNNVALAGHVHLGDWSILSGYTLVHQYLHIGAHSFAGAGTFLTQDLPAYVTATGNPASARTINKEGLRRRGFSRESIAAISKAYKIVYRKGLSIDEAISEITPLAREYPEVQVFVDSILASKRGITR